MFVVCFLLTIAVLPPAYSGTSRKYNTTLSVYDGPNFKGKGFGNIKVNNGYFDLQKANLVKGIKSFKIDTGNCVELHKNNPPNKGNPGDWSYTTGWAHRSNVDPNVKTFAPCEINRKYINCPSGHYVKTIAWDNSKQLTTGVEVSCSLPGSDEIQTVLRSHGSSNLPDVSKCKSGKQLLAINQLKSSRKEMVIKLLHQGCSPKAPKYSESKYAPDEAWDVHYGYTSDCPKGQIMIGVALDIETNSNFVKYFGINCKAPNPGEDCIPSDRKQVLFECGSSTDTRPMTCQQTKLVGTVITSSTTKAEQEAEKFYDEYTFTLGGILKALGIKFKYSYGSSNTTGYNWTQTSTSTFFEETKTKVRIEAPAGCTTSVVEVVGKCLWMELRPNHFERHDHPKNCSKVIES